MPINTEMAVGGGSGQTNTFGKQINTQLAKIQHIGKAKWNGNRNPDHLTLCLFSLPTNVCPLLWGCDQRPWKCRTWRYHLAFPMKTRFRLRRRRVQFWALTFLSGHFRIRWPYALGNSFFFFFVCLSLLAGRHLAKDVLHCNSNSSTPTDLSCGRRIIKYFHLCAGNFVRAFIHTPATAAAAD